MGQEYLLPRSNGNVELNEIKCFDNELMAGDFDDYDEGQDVFD